MTTTALSTMVRHAGIEDCEDLRQLHRAEEVAAALVVSQGVFLGEATGNANTTAISSSSSGVDTVYNPGI